MGKIGAQFLGLKVIDLSDDTAVASGGNHAYQYLQPPAGQVYKVNSLRYLAADPVGSTAGDHYFRVYPYDLDEYSIYFKVTSNTGSNVSVLGTTLSGNTESPTGNDQLHFIQSIIASNTYKQVLDYYNNTDANQTGTRTLILLVEVYKEAL